MNTSSFQNDTFSISLRKIVDNTSIIIGVSSAKLESTANDTPQVSVYKLAYNSWLYAAYFGYPEEAPHPSQTIPILLRQAVDAISYLT